MGRSGSVNGASVALEFLPREIAVDGGEVLPVACHGPDAGPLADRIAGMRLEGRAGGVDLGPILAEARLPLPGVLPQSASADLLAGRLPEALGTLLSQIAAQGFAGAGQIYAMALCLAGLTRNAPAWELLSLVAGALNEHPALTALRGYLALQVGEADQGRRALSRAALAARGTPEHRPILRFTQNVLLIHQFGG